MSKILIKVSFISLFIAGATLLVSCSANSNQTDNTSTSMDSHAGMSQNHHNMMGGSEMTHDMSMNMGPADKEYDLRFIDAMILHHKGAVNMANEALNKSKRPEIKKLATEIISAQKKEIAQMEQWRKTWYPRAGNAPVAWSARMNHSMTMSREQMDNMMMNMDLGAADAGFDKRFIDSMIPHHEGAVVMAKDALAKSTRTEIRQLSNNILATQQQEIDLMKKWRDTWYGK